MDARTFICLFDLKPYDSRVAPALRRYLRDYDPAQVVELMREASRRAPSSAGDDFQHWADAIGPDKGYKPSERTMRELCGMILPAFCVPRGLGFDPMQDADKFVPWLSDRSEWFADLMDGGEELAGGRLEFSFGSGALIATRQQIQQFLEEVRGAPAPEGALAADYANLRKMLECADSAERYTLLKTGLPVVVRAAEAAPR